ncbi:Gfo/Idh/MocA family oxidoreductase [bacterium]|nr:Gfo/Idh/MocA family oxidoreductase [candidate division CSSED10-310 bacterium]
MESKQIGLIGTGVWGRNLMRNFYELGVLKCACDIREELRSEVSKIAPGVNFITDPNKVIHDPDCQAVVIATSALEHGKLTREALLQGKDVFVEKPLAIKLEEGKELVKLARDTNRVLMVGHILNYHPAVQKLKELVNNGDLGKIRYIYSNRLNIGRIRTEENILWSFAPHDISIVLSLLNEMPQSISCQGESYISESVYDVTMTQMIFPSGVQGHIFVSWLHPFKEQRLVIVGSEKMAVLDDTIAEKLKVYPHEVKWRGRIPTAVRAEAEIVSFESKEPLRAECEHFIACIQQRTTPMTDGIEALRVLQVLDACQRSLHHQGSTVTIAGDNDPQTKFSAHPTAIIDEPCQIGKGTRIWHFAHVMQGAKIGENCSLGQNVYVGSKAVIGNNVKIQNNVSVYDRVILDDNVFCGPSMVFTNVINPRSEIKRKDEYMPTRVSRGATLGANCTIVCGNNIGEYAFVAAGSVVTKNVPAFACVAGVPAIRIGWVCRCGIKLTFSKDTAVCKTCNRKYRMTNNKTVRLLENEA